MAKTKERTGRGGDAVDRNVRASVRLGWVLVTLGMLLGLVLEGFHLVKSPFYLELRLRRELLTLAHTHGTLFGLLNLAFAWTLDRGFADPGRLRGAGIALRAGSVLLPVGFLVGGIAAYEGDPFLGVVLVPVGALMAIVGIAAVALATARRDRG